MKIPVIDGPAEGVLVDCPDLPQGFRPSGFFWSVGNERTEYRAYSFGGIDGRLRWALAHDKYNVHRHIMELRYRRSTMWRFHCRTDNGGYCFYHPRSRRYYTVSTTDFWGDRCLTGSSGPSGRREDDR